MAFTKITQADLESRGATTLPNQPTISASLLKQEFDAPAKEIVAPAFNNLIDELEADTAADSLGVSMPEGRTGDSTIQGAIDSISVDLGTAEGKVTELEELKHSHSNKATIDKFSEASDKLYWNGSPVGGGGGTGDYVDLENKPQINSVTLIGNMSAHDLGLATESALANKVDKETDKGLSSNDYTDGEKADVAKIDTIEGNVGTLTSSVGIVQGKITTLEGQMLGVQDGLNNKVDKVAGKGLSTKDYTNEDKAKVDSLGTASTKNSTSVVTSSSDLVESGAVKDIVGWGNKNLVVEVSKNTNIDSSGVITSGSYDMWYGKVTQGVVYTITSNDNTGFVGGFFTQKPAIGSTSYDGQRIVTSDKTFTAPITGYVAFRSYTGYTTGQLEKGNTATAYEPYHASVDEYCSSKQLLEDTVGWVSDNQAKLYNWTGEFQGITFTYTKEQLVVNGTATANTSQPSSGSVPEDGKYTLKAGTYKIICDVDNVYWEVLSLNPVVVITSGSKTFTITEDTTVFIRANIKNGTSFNNKVVHVSLRKLSVEEKKADNSVITNNIETGTTYSRAYAVGEHLLNNGVFRTVKSAVSSGETITDNNSFVDTVTGKKTITVTPEAGVTYDTNKCVISNNIIVLNIVIDSRSFSDSSATLVGTVESTYKPNVEIYSAGVSANGIPCRVAVNTSGQIFVRPETSITNSKVGFTIVYTI